MLGTGHTRTPGRCGPFYFPLELGEASRGVLEFDCSLTSNLGLTLGAFPAEWPYTPC